MVSLKLSSSDFFMLSYNGIAHGRFGVPARDIIFVTRVKIWCAGYKILYICYNTVELTSSMPVNSRMSFHSSGESRRFASSSRSKTHLSMACAQCVIYLNMRNKSTNLPLIKEVPVPSWHAYNSTSSQHRISP